MVQKYFKNFLSKIILGRKILNLNFFLYPKKFEPKKIQGPKNFGSKEIGSEKKLDSK